MHQPAKETEHAQRVRIEWSNRSLQQNWSQERRSQSWDGWGVYRRKAGPESGIASNFLWLQKMEIPSDLSFYQTIPTGLCSHSGPNRSENCDSIRCFLRDKTMMVGGKEAWPEETSQETASVDNSDFGSLRKRRESTWLLPSNPGGLRRGSALCTSTDQGSSW